jgi:hypothetical protein
VVGDAAYVGERLRNVDGRISWTSRLKVTSVLHELPPPPWRRPYCSPCDNAQTGRPGDRRVAQSGVAPQGVVAYVHCDHLLLIPEVYELTGTITPHQNYCFDHQLVVVGYPVRRASAGVEVRTRTKYIRIRRRPGLRATIVLCDC